MISTYKDRYNQLRKAYSDLDKSLNSYKTRINGFEKWKNELIKMHKFITGTEPRIEGDYWMIDDHRGYDLWLMYEQGLNAQES